MYCLVVEICVISCLFSHCWKTWGFDVSRCRICGCTLQKKKKKDVEVGISCGVKVKNRGSYLSNSTLNNSRLWLQESQPCSGFSCCFLFSRGSASSESKYILCTFLKIYQNENLKIHVCFLVFWRHQVQADVVLIWQFSQPEDSFNDHVTCGGSIRFCIAAAVVPNYSLWYCVHNICTFYYNSCIWVKIHSINISVSECLLPSCFYINSFKTNGNYSCSIRHQCAKLVRKTAITLINIWIKVVLTD